MNFNAINQVISVRLRYIAMNREECVWQLCTATWWVPTSGKLFLAEGIERLKGNIYEDERAWADKEFASKSALKLALIVDIIEWVEARIAKHIARLDRILIDFCVIGRTVECHGFPFASFLTVVIHNTNVPRACSYSDLFHGSYGIFIATLLFRFSRKFPHWPKPSSCCCNTGIYEPVPLFRGRSRNAFYHVPLRRVWGKNC